MQPRLLLALTIAPLLAACAASGGPVESAPTSASGARRPATPVRTPVRRTPPPAQVQALPGTEGVIGATRAELLRQFGTARLDVWEGDARKLQFAGAACVLDVFLYPKNAGAEPQATYVDARRPSDGRDVDRAACIGALRRP
jgi:hypothetical protein